MRNSVNSSRLVGAILLVAILITYAVVNHQAPVEKSSPDSEFIIRSYNSEIKLRTYRIKSELVDSIQSYITSHSDQSDLTPVVLVDACDEYGVDVRLALAQGLLESHFGTRGSSQYTNNVWNVGVFDGDTGDKINKTYRYKHPDLSIIPYVKLIKTRYLVNKTIEDLLINFVDVDDHHYASDPNYETKLNSIIKSMTGIDSIYTEYRHNLLEIKKGELK